MPSDLPALARDVRKQCALLARALDDLCAVRSEEAEEALTEHLEAAGPAQQKLAAAVARLNARRGEVDALPAASRREVTLAVREARRQLQVAVVACEDLADGVARALCVIRRRLDDVHRGARLLRGYRRAAQ